MSDIWTIIWKESFVVGIMGIYLPLQFGPQWVNLTPIGMVLLLWVPFFVIISFIGDAILLGLSLLSFQRSRLILS